MFRVQQTTSSLCCSLHRWFVDGIPQYEQNPLEKQINSGAHYRLQHDRRKHAPARSFIEEPRHAWISLIPPTARDATAPDKNSVQNTPHVPAFARQRKVECNNCLTLVYGLYQKHDENSTAPPPLSLATHQIALHRWRVVHYKERDTKRAQGGSHNSGADQHKAPPACLVDKHARHRGHHHQGQSHRYRRQHLGHSNTQPQQKYKKKGRRRKRVSNALLYVSNANTVDRGVRASRINPLPLDGVR